MQICVLPAHGEKPLVRIGDVKGDDRVWDKLERNQGRLCLSQRKDVYLVSMLEPDYGGATAEKVVISSEWGRCWSGPGAVKE